MSYRRGSAGTGLLQEAPLTMALIVINVFVFLLQRTRNSSSIYILDSGTTAGRLPVQGAVDAHYALWGPMVSAGEWWRLLTSGFLHASPLHIGSNMLALFFVGRAMEPALGSLRLGLIYFVSLAAGSLGVIIVDPGSLSLGASGAIFGLMGGLLVIARARGISLTQSGIGPVILLNLAFTFTIPGISKGAHVGGLIGGAALGLFVVELDRRRQFAARGMQVLVAVSASAFAALLIAAVALARSKYPSLG
jgi:membrane associated rhomboid family serine protease